VTNSKTENLKIIDEVSNIIRCDVRLALEARRTEGLHSTAYVVTNNFGEPGSVYVEFVESSEFFKDFPNLILARTGRTPELELYVGDFQKISELKRKASFDCYTQENVRKAIDFYFSDICKVFET
jgi:hypothetical protein